MTTTEQRRPTTSRSAPRSQPAEESGLARLATWCHDHRWWVLVAWIVGLVAVNVLAQSAGSNFTNNLSGGTQQAQQILNSQFPALSGSPAQVVVTTTGPFTDPANQERTAKLVAALRPVGPRLIRDQPVQPAGCGPDLQERAHRLRTDQLRPVGRQSAGQRRPEGDRHRGVLPDIGLPRGPRRRGHRHRGGGQARAERGHRHPGRHHHHAAGLRLGGGHGPADHDGPVRYRRGLRRAGPALPCGGHAHLRPRDHGHDRARRGHRLRTLRRHPLSTGNGGGP